MKQTFLAQLMIGVVCLAADANAQMVDYSGLEEIFGEPVTTSATGKPQRVSEVPVSMEIISRKEIEDSGAIDIPSLLRRVSGVEVTRSFIGHADVNIRGYNQSLSNRLLVLVNGRQVYQDQYGMTIWQSLPIHLNEIRQIEVIRGPNSSLYGFNAASGVVNIVTDRPLADDNSTYQLRAGTQDFREISGMETLRFSDKFAMRLSGSRLQTDGFSRDTSFGSAVRDDDALDKYSFNMDGEYIFTPETSLRFESGIGAADVDLDIPFNIASNIQTLSRHLSADITHDAGDYGLWNLRAYRNESNFKSAVDSLGETVVPPVENILHVVQLSDLISLNATNTLRLGLEYRDNQAESQLIGQYPGRYSMQILAANAMWNWQINDQLSWTNSGRVDHWETKRDGALNTFETVRPVSLEGREETEFTFNSGLLFKADDVSSYRFSVGRGIRIPSLVELSQNAIINGVVESYGNPMLEPESNLTFEVGYNRLLSTGEDRTELFTNIYTQQLRDVMSGTVYGFGSGAGALADTTFENVGDSRAYGLELGLKGTQWSKTLQWGINYAYINIDDDPQSGPQRFMEYGSNQPYHKINAMVHYDYNDWDMGLTGSFVSGRDSAQLLGVDFFGNEIQNLDQESYFLLGGSVGYKIREGVHLSLDGYNLVDEHNERPSFVLGASNDNGGGNRLGRTLLLTLTTRF